MARDESDREDLLREATALVERIELLIVSNDSPDKLTAAPSARVVVGFRVNGAFSVFFDDAPVYQFNTAGHLRRAYVGGLLFKSAHGRLMSLNRVRRNHVVELQRHDLSDTEQSEFIAQMADRMHELEAVLDSGRYEIAGQVPEGADVVGRVRCWLANRDDWPVAATPRV